MIILLTGSSGLIGSALQPVFKARHDELIRLVRRPDRVSEDAVFWQSGHPLKIDRIDAVIHLAGEPIAGRWSKGKKERIYDSRVTYTRALMQALAALKKPPRHIISASAIGYYGDRGDMILDENASPGSGFLAEVCRDWEQAALEGSPVAARVVLLRIGMVLASDGGALRTMLPAFKLGLGGVVGHGRQHISWIALPDLVRAIMFILDNETIAGPVNLTSPQPVTNREFTRTLGAVIHRPTVFPAPRFGIRILFGEMGDSLLLSGSRVMPRALPDHGFEFNYPDLNSALTHLLRGEL